MASSSSHRMGEMVSRPTSVPDPSRTEEGKAMQPTTDEQHHSQISKSDTYNLKDKQEQKKDRPWAVTNSLLFLI